MHSFPGAAASIRNDAVGDTRRITHPKRTDEPQAEGPFTQQVFARSNSKGLQRQQGRRSPVQPRAASGAAALGQRAKEDRQRATAPPPSGRPRTAPLTLISKLNY